MDVRISFISLFWGLAAGGLAWHSVRLGRQITYVTLADGRRQERRLPLLFRALLPATPVLTPFLRRPGFDKVRARLRRRITAAGYDDLLAEEEFLALRVIEPLLPGLLLALLTFLTLHAAPYAFLRRMSLPVSFVPFLLLLLHPVVWLRRVLAARHHSIRRSLPFVLDLLTLSVEAGIDFMTALQRYVQRGRVDALGEELIRVIREIQVGKTRREALRDMSRRVDLPDLRSVVNALVQADEFGVSIGSILRIQADQIRQRRFERAEKLANEAPVKLLGPLLLFIFPAVFLILVMPFLHRLAQMGLF
jgi:tight adherence protein C